MVVFYNIQGRWVGVVLKIIDDEGVYIGDRIEGYYFSLYVICNKAISFDKYCIKRLLWLPVKCIRIAKYSDVNNFIKLFMYVPFSS